MPAGLLFASDGALAKPVASDGALAKPVASDGALAKPVLGHVERVLPALGLEAPPADAFASPDLANECLGHSLR